MTFLAAAEQDVAFERVNRKSALFSKMCFEKVLHLFFFAICRNIGFSQAEHFCWLYSCCGLTQSSTVTGKTVLCSDKTDMIVGCRSAGTNTNLSKRAFFATMLVNRDLPSKNRCLLSVSCVENLNLLCGTWLGMSKEIVNGIHTLENNNSFGKKQWPSLTYITKRQEKFCVSEYKFEKFCEFFQPFFSQTNVCAFAKTLFHSAHEERTIDSLCACGPDTSGPLILQGFPRLLDKKTRQALFNPRTWSFL